MRLKHVCKSRAFSVVNILDVNIFDAGGWGGICISNRVLALWNAS